MAGNGIEIAESLYQSPFAPQTGGVVCQYLPARLKATGRILKLFEEVGIYRQYRYSCFITNLTLPPPLV
ncbi:MAG: hypothetical protein N2050_01110 [Flavobacteriales bacterium]|nr:hypothetical protein [Flavobacteriales bacterium]